MGPVAAGSEGGVTGKLKGSCPVGVSLLREDGVRGSCLQAEAQQSQLAVRVASSLGADHVHHGSQCGPPAWPDHIFRLTDPATLLSTRACQTAEVSGAKPIWVRQEASAGAWSLPAWLQVMLA